MSDVENIDRLQKARLYLVTPARPEAGELKEFLPGVLEAGVDVVQLREKDMEAGPLLQVCATVRSITHDFGALFFVNDRLDVAIAAQADGVHLGQDDLPLFEVQAQAGEEMLTGVSTHSEGQVDEAAASAADYLAVGPVFETPTKPGRPAAGTEVVAYAANCAPRPFFAIGGIDLESLPAVMEAGARRVAVLRALTESNDPPAVARKMKRLLESAGPLPAFEARRPQICI